MREWEAGPWGVWFLGGIKTVPRLFSCGHRDDRDLHSFPARPSAGDIGLTWLTTGPARVGGAARRYGVFGTRPHFVRTSESLKAWDAGTWGVWFLGGLKTIPQLSPGEHRTVGGSQRTLGHTSARDIGLTWLTTGPARVGGAARRYGFFGTSPHFVRTSESF